MRFSIITINRFVEQKAASDAAYREELRKRGRVTLACGRALSDEELLARLASLGIHLDRAEFLRRSEPFVSAEEMARAVSDDPRLKIADRDQDWVWIAFTCLWERWSGERPSLEMIDDTMQEGYEADQARDETRACRLWLKTWKDIRSVMETRGIRSLQEWDDRYPGTQCLFNWVQDFTLLLHNAGLRDRSATEERRAVLETLLEQGLVDENLRDHCRSDLAETYFDLGMPEKGEQLFRQWLQERPRWGWGWIHWADCYYLCAHGREKDPARAEQLLKQALAVPGVEDREEVLDRLKELYRETGRASEAKAVQAQIEQLSKPAPAKPIARPAPAPPRPRSIIPEPAPARAPARVGRNDPCPCGSGKKYKKCCLRE